ncbi:MAG: hypothetical protein LBN35_03460 [Clostridiales Family XIII bacterium]|jgi:hypothetical protein|nr:hypothetical protein [Clostridiales Family XIII bacterium]
MLIIVIIILLLTTGMILLTPPRFRLVSIAGQRTGRETAKRLAAAAGRYSIEAVMRSRKRERMDREIFDAISTIRNIIATHRSGKVSADMLLEQLSQADGLLAPVYKKALSCLRLGKKEAMVTVFAEDVGTEIAQDFIRIIVRWDDVSPEKLASTLLSYQSAMKEMRTTKLKQSGEVLSDIVFFPVILNVLIVLMNFIFVGYFIEQRDLINQLFF